MLKTIHDIFNNRRLRKLALKLRWLIMIGIAVALAQYGQRDWLVIGFAVSALGEAIQTWSFASLVKNEELTARGPYVLTRNPMYLGRFLLILGFVLLWANPYVTAVYVVLYYFYMVNRVGREETMLAPLLGDRYAEYCRRVNRFAPMLSRMGDPAIRYFNANVLTSNNGHWNLFGWLLAWSVVAAYILWLRG